MKKRCKVVVLGLRIILILTLAGVAGKVYLVQRVICIAVLAFVVVARKEKEGCVGVYFYTLTHHRSEKCL